MYETEGLPGTPTVKVFGPTVRTEIATVLDLPEAFTPANEKTPSRYVAPVGSAAISGSPSTTTLTDPFDVVDPGGDDGTYPSMSSNFGSHATTQNPSPMS